MSAMSAPSAIDQVQQTLTVELDRVREHGISLAVKSREGELSVTIDTLTRIVKTLRPGTWISAEHRIAALTDVLAKAIDQLPEERLPGATEHSTITWRSAARILFQAPPLPFELFVAVKKANPDKSAQLSVKAARYVQNTAGLPGDDKSFEDVSRLLCQELARILLREEMTASPGEP